jgi:hypothetical protein
MELHDQAAQAAEIVKIVAVIVRGGLMKLTENSNTKTAIPKNTHANVLSPRAERDQRRRERYRHNYCA